MGEHPNNDDPMHHFLALRCNHAGKDGQVCDQSLEQGWVAGCGHLFCYEHAKEYFAHQDECPVCHSGPVKVLRMDLSRPAVKRRGGRQLIGLAPPEAMQAAEDAVNFWVDQKAFERHRQTQRFEKSKENLKMCEQHLHQRLQEAEATCKDLQSEQQQLEQQIEEANKESKQASDNCQRWKRDLAEAESKCRNLQQQMSSGRLPRDSFASGPAAQRPSFHGLADDRNSRPPPFREDARGALELGSSQTCGARNFRDQGCAGEESWLRDFKGPSLLPRRRDGGAPLPPRSTAEGSRLGENDFMGPPSGARLGERGGGFQGPAGALGPAMADALCLGGALPPSGRKTPAFGVTPGSAFGGGRFTKRRIT